MTFGAANWYASTYSHQIYNEEEQDGYNSLPQADTILHFRGFSKMAEGGAAKLRYGDEDNPKTELSGGQEDS